MSSPISAPVAYTDYGALRHSVPDGQAGIEQAARHFESVFIDMWLKAARDANAALSEDNFMNSSEMLMRQEMFDHEMAVHIAQGGGIGLSPVIIRQLGGEADIPLRQPAEFAVTPSQPAANQIPEIQVDSSGGTKLAAFTNPGEFVSKLRPVIERIAGAAGLPPLAVLSQAALETGWGTQVIGTSDGALSHNLFGMKSTSDQQAAVEVRSKEFEFGRWIDRISRFRSYPDWEASVRDYVQTLQQTPRYGDALRSGGDAVQFVQGLQNAGYATDPGYAEKILRVMNTVMALGE